MEGTRHEALVYRGEDGFLSEIVPFILEGLQRAEPVMVMVDERKIERLRSKLGPRSNDVRFLNMTDLGRNPARIIPAWRAFIDSEADRRAYRGVGEPVWASRTPEELAECSRHEALLNLALAEVPGWLLCPYDGSSLDDSVLAEARRNHPLIAEDGCSSASETYIGLGDIRKPFDAPLPEPPRDAETRSFMGDDLRDLRGFVAERALGYGLPTDRSADLILVTNELASNSVVHGGGRGTLQIWREDAAVVCEIRDRGRIDDPLAGRRHPDLTGSGYGLWIVNQLCDLVEIRSGDEGAVVRLHMS